MTLFGIEITSPFRIRTRSRGLKAPASIEGFVNTLANLPLDQQAVVKRFLPGISSERHAQLRAYGLVPGCPVSVVQHTPVTVIRIEHLELALEHSLAKEVQVTLMD